MNTKSFLTPVEVKGIDRDNHSLTAFASTESVDRDGDIVVAAGIGTAHYRRNPVVLACHQHRLYDGKSPVIGKSLGETVTEGGLMFNPQYAVKTELGNDYWKLYEGGFMSAFSIGFSVDKQEQMRDQDDRFSGYKFTATELWEVSACPVPSNREALVAGKSAGIKLAGHLMKEMDQLTAFREVLHEHTCRQTAAIMAAIEGKFATLQAAVDEAVGMTMGAEPDPNEHYFSTQLRDAVDGFVAAVGAPAEN